MIVIFFFGNTIIPDGIGIQDGTNSVKFDTKLFVQLIEEKGLVLLKKSNTPAMKKLKNTALAEISHELSRSGTKYGPKQVQKKLSNLRLRVKNKTDMNRSGNRKIVLSQPESQLFKLMQGEQNPSLTEVPCK